MLKFSKECDRFAHEIDEFLFKKDFEGMISYLPGLKAFANEHDTPEYAPIFYYLGTICGELANQLHREGKNYLDHDIVEYRKSAMLYFRKALKYIPNPSETFLVFYHLDESAFEKFTMRLLVLAREALMYLVYAIGINENKKDSKNTDSKAVSLNVFDFADDWKR
nr:hypothetical protein [uncultured Blautia sp.]